MGQGSVTNTTTTSNRDINNTQEITRDQVTGLLNGSVNVDNRLLTESGRALDGHVQACVYGDTCDAYNLFPQNSNFNNSAYKVYFENIVRKAEKDGKSIGKATVMFTRNDPSSLRPDKVFVKFTIDGKKLDPVMFENKAGGGIKGTNRLKF